MKKIVEDSNWLDIDVLEDYLDGKLDDKMMYRVEREALEDPFVAQALAGLSQSPKRSRQSLSLLQKQLETRIAGHEESKKESVITGQRLSIAATAALIFILGGIIFWMKYNNNQKAKVPAVVEVNLDPAHAMDKAKPTVGWPGYFSYLKENNQLTKKETIGKAVELSFTIGKDGRPENVRVYKSLGKAYDAEALRLLKAGPNWEIPPDPAFVMKLNIDF
ncbi:energy transducer TonB [Pedobacter sp. SAFR-022]|uniref:energy transducer TonB n=1 Tax=Pedobacter sp. SAFR-022 TaxID=3436861 RepID=UPI003F7F2F10